MQSSEQGVRGAQPPGRWWRTLAPFLATVAAGLWAFHRMYIRLWQVIFGMAEEDMTFAAIVPFFSLYLLWEDRKEIAKAATEGKPSFWGLLASAPLLFVALIGSRGEQLRLEQLGFIGLCVAIPWTFYGWRLARRLVFPAAYLLFTIPLASFLDIVTVHLRLFAVSAATAFLNGVGIEAVQQGTSLSAGGTMPFSIDVAEPCSGLRSLFALAALTAAYARLYQPTWPRRLALFAFAVPLAVIGNIARVVSICLASAIFGSEFGTGFYHDYSGYIVFLVAISLMLAVSAAIDKICAKPKDVISQDSQTPNQNGQNAPDSVNFPTDSVNPVKSGHQAFRIVFAALFIAAFANQAKMPAPEYMPDLACALPEKVGEYVADDLLFCQSETCMRSFPVKTLAVRDVCPVCGGALDSMALGERNILPDDTRVVKKVYTSRLGDAFYVTMVYGGRTRSSLHRPELCLPSQGNLMRAKHNTEAAGRPFHEIDFTGRHGETTTLAYTFFNQDGFKTASHTARIFRDVWDRSVHNRIDRWAMVTVAQSPSRPFLLDRFLVPLSESLP